jgi:sec-independent protein translocase protein TatB
VFDIGLPEFFVLGLIALLVFGPERLPEVALQAARLIRKLKGMADTAKTELTADLEPHMRELRELRELDPRQMAKRYVLDPADEDGTLKSLKSKNLLRDPDLGKKTDRVKRAATAGVAAVTAGREAVAEGASAAPSNGSSHQADLGGTSPEADGPALPAAMAPAVTPPGERPPYDLDAT